MEKALLAKIDLPHLHMNVILCYPNGDNHAEVEYQVKCMVLKFPDNIVHLEGGSICLVVTV